MEIGGNSKKREREGEENMNRLWENTNRGEMVEMGQSREAKR